MSEHDELNPVDQEVVEALRSLVPAAVRIDPVAAAFAAGRQSAQNQLVRWRALAATLLVACTAAWLWPAGDYGADGNRPQPAIASQFSNSSWSDAHSQSLAALQHSLVRNGIQSLPTTSIPPTGVIRIGDRL
jgi:hypothetical protein